MKMKKKSAMILAAAMSVVMMTGCGGKKEEAERVRDLDVSKYVTLGEYSGLEVTVTPKAEITDADIDTYVNTNFLSSYKEDVDVTDRPVETGDTVYYTCVGTIDGEVFDGGSTSDGDEWNTVIGSGTMIDGFEDGFIGMEAGETKEIYCTFPDPYPSNTELSGKDAVFTVTLNSVTLTTYPELTDEILAEIESDYATVQEAREAVREILEEQAQSTYEENVQSAILSAVLTNCEFQEPPEFMIEKNSAAFRENFESYAAMFGMDFATFLSQLYNMTEEQFDEQAKAFGSAAAQQTIAFEAIAIAEGLNEVTDEELMAEAEAYIAESTYYESTDALFADVDQDSFRDYIVSQRVISWLLENNTVAE